MDMIQSIIRLRLKIRDPYGYPKIVVGAVPAEPDELTIYRTGEDQYFDADKERLKIRLSDATLEDMIARHGIHAECRCYAEIMKDLGHELRISKLTTGAESTEWQSLNDLYLFYKALADECSKQIAAEMGKDSGFIGRSKQPKICGGWDL